MEAYILRLQSRLGAFWCNCRDNPASFPPLRKKCSNTRRVKAKHLGSQRGEQHSGKVAVSRYVADGLFRRAAAEGNKDLARRMWVDLTNWAIPRLRWIH